ncbi:DUF1566 domain-containing protein [Legionella spiritensis]|uniref:DUF1566 domain-containing protein n=1 Tax=Legionella spiritensis TaxID=452 RepID=UPI000F6D528E|nr:DUF1566 domain-containing protein [Legionella spiritensis]VEG90416.1 protein with a bacterial immunoglobulin-like domain [Legionella spiritensis]
MKIWRFSQFIPGMVSFLLLTSVQAGAPLWTFTPLTATSMILPLNGTATVNYRVTNQSARPHTLVVKPVQGITQITNGAGLCGNPFVLPSRGASCILSLQINASQLTDNITGGPMVCQQGSTLQCYQPGANDILDISILDPSTSAAISVTGSPLVLIVNGAAGVLTIHNTSTDVTATNIKSDFTGTALAGKVTETGNTCASVAPGTSCQLTFTPGATGVAQTSFPVKGDNTTTINPDIAVVTVGDPFHGGVVACTDGGLDNLIAATMDISANIIWGNYILTGANSNTDGATNTTTIVAVLGNNGGMPYAAQLCNDFAIDSQGNAPCQVGNVCYNDWFLPARQQLHCLFLNQVPVGNFFPDNYWTSTENSNTEAWFQSFAIDIQFVDDKLLNPDRVRCVRPLS